MCRGLGPEAAQCLVRSKGSANTAVGAWTDQRLSSVLGGGCLISVPRPCSYCGLCSLWQFRVLFASLAALFWYTYLASLGE
ncbi:hypothetical protein J1605_011515 [Eschrichtius robustus]|uniref:Uncharacterized protein n=1 Tax=Eschrichtius robustus TaxID=9764 RepID=A0AB34GQ03_ESCRO|nr:hypothetical protein J1605_011515 [Eschrichtius robustus]